MRFNTTVTQNKQQTSSCTYDKLSNMQDLQYSHFKALPLANALAGAAGEQHSTHRMETPAKPSPATDQNLLGA
jgi:hypothetical protein